MLMVLAAVPDVVHKDEAGDIRVRPAAAVEDITEYAQGLFTGDAWIYGSAWYKREFFDNMPPRFLRSLRYLLTSGLLATHDRFVRGRLAHRKSSGSAQGRRDLRGRRARLRPRLAAADGGRRRLPQLRVPHRAGRQHHER